MKLYTSSLAPWKQLGLKVLLLLGLSAWGTDNSYGMAIAIENNNIEELITNTSGLTPQEESLLVDTIEGIVSNTKRTWYPNTFAPSDDNSHSVSSDTQQIIKLQALTDTGMKVIGMVDERFKEIQERKRKESGTWAFLDDSDNFPYRISTNTRDLVFEIQKYDCLTNKGVNVPSNYTTAGSLWMQYADNVYVPFDCPKEHDFDREKAAKEHQRLMARLSRAKRRVSDPVDDDSITIIQVNLTLTEEIFQRTLYNQTSSDYIAMTSNLTSVIGKIFNSATGCNGVNGFSYRPGSVIATFHIEMTGPNGTVTFVESKLQSAIVNNTLGGIAVNLSLLQVGEFSVECEKNFTTAKGSISSPVVNGLYPINADCVWRITVDKNYTIVMQFEKFNLEKDKKCKYDYVAFYDGNYPNPEDHPNRELMRFCGNSTPPHSYPAHGYPVNSSSNEITVHFKTDSTKQRTGFTVIWHTVLRYDLRIPKIIPQFVTALSFIYNPWSTIKDAAIPLGKATTCPESWGEDSCYFFAKQNVISRIISVFLSRDVKIKSSNPVVIKFEHILDETLFPEAYTGRKTCVTWDHTIKSPQNGAWSKTGCSASFSNLTHTWCKCAHTGVFAVLGEMEAPPKDLHIKANVYFGCAVFLILVIATTHSLATKEKKTTGELFHIFETIVSGILMVIFLTGAHVPAEKELCGFLAFFLYYLVLSQFTWMLLTVIWMQNLLKRFLSERVKIKIVYFVLGWGIPIVLAGVAGKINIDKHGHKDNVCWVSISGAGTVWGYGAPVFAMFIVTVAALVYLLLPSTKSNYDCGKLRPRIAKEFVIMLSFILTWCLGVKVILNDCFNNQYFFCIFLILQGAVNYNVCHESTELFWKEVVKTENESEKEDNNDSSGKDKNEEQQEEKEKENQPPRMTVKTLKNLNIYKENGVFVIEA